MLNPFNKTKETHPIADIFKNHPENQKIAILNLLLTVANADGEEASDKELQYLNIYRRVLGVNSNQAIKYLIDYGTERIIKDLKLIQNELKEYLALACWMMITCDGPPKKVQIQVAGGMLEEIGVKPDDFFSVIKKITNLTYEAYSNTLNPENLGVNILKVKVTKVSSKANSNGNYIHTLKSEVKILGQEKPSTYFIALPVVKPVGRELEINMDLFKIVERPYVMPNSDNGDVQTIQLKWLVNKDPG